MKVKIFRGQNSGILEEEINDWLEHKGYQNKQFYTKIYHITQSQDAGDTDYIGMIVICIWYK